MMPYSTLTLEDTSNTKAGTITRGYSNYGAGVYVSNASTFTMKGGNLSKNTAKRYNSYDVHGGGVYIDYGGTFIMEGGTIAENVAYSQTNSNRTGGEGGGVCAYGDFEMKDGTISSCSAANGGGVYVSDRGIFTMSGGEITENESIGGSGVEVYGIFTMINGTISDNITRWPTYTNAPIQGEGGGVLLRGTGSFTMEGGLIARNTGQDGGGVYVAPNTIFTMNDGTISENISVDGGGVRVDGTFKLNGGTISKNTASDEPTIARFEPRLGGGVFVFPGGSLSLSGNPKIIDNTSSMSGNIITENVAVSEAGTINLGKLTEGARIGISVYHRLILWDSSPSDYSYEYATPTINSPVQFTWPGTWSSDIDNYADSVQYFFSDRKGYGVRANNDGKYLELAPAFTVTFDTQGGELPLGAADTKTVVYGATWRTTHSY